MLAPRSDNPRLLISKLREGDYTHAGGTEAIDIVLRSLSELFDVNNTTLKILDAGCGLGGTANYIKDKIPSDLYGIDIDDKALEHAQQYPDIHFLNCDVVNVKNIFARHEFDIVYLFNAFYAFPDQITALKSLASVTKDQGLLIIFDYTYPNNHPRAAFTDLAGKEMHPIVLPDFERLLHETGWKLIKTINLDSQYEKWYTRVINTLQARKNTLLNEFTEDAYNKVNETFLLLLSNIRQKILGGSVFFARNNL